MKAFRLYSHQPRRSGLVQQLGAAIGLRPLGFFTETYWDDRVIGYAEEIAGYQGEGLPMMQGCLGDHYYDEYYIGDYE